MFMSLAKVAHALAATHTGSDVSFTSVSTDSRHIQAGELFIALKGPNFDGHDYLEKAIAKGACAAIVSQSSALSIPSLQVDNTLIALGQLATLHRQSFDIPVIGLTGSCGKTTTKNMITAILNVKHNILATQGNLNNQIGVPLTLLNINATHDYAVIEMGANHPNEIAYLSNIVKPNIALITNAYPVHLEGFKTLEGVAQAKSEIYAALSEAGIGIINYDDSFANQWLSILAEHKTFSFGFDGQVDVTAKHIQYNEQQCGQFDLHVGDQQMSVCLNVMGVENIMNALAASCVAYALNIPLEQIKKGLESVEVATGRMQQMSGLKGARLINDSYNSNPIASKAAIDMLASCSGERILVFADMMELGVDAVRYHKEVGDYAKLSGIERVFTTGQLAVATAEQFGDNAQHFKTTDELIASLKPLLHADMTILIKASRSQRLERVVTALMDKEI